MPVDRNQTILFVAPSAYLLGGVQIWLQYLLPGLEHHGIKCICCAVDGDYHDAAAYFDAYQFTFQSSVSNPTGTHYGRIKNLAEAIVNSDADVVVGVNIADVYPATHRARKIRQKPIRLVATLHGFGADYLADLDFFEPVIDAVVVTNKLTEDVLKKTTSMPSEKIYYAPYGVEVGTLPASRERSGPGMKILYSGRIENQQKRCADLVAVVQELCAEGLDFELIIAGDGNFKDQLERTMRDCAPAERVTFTGALQHAQLLDHVLPSCDVLLITSAWETGPIVAWEAMSQGVVVVTSKYIGARQEAALIDGVNCLMFEIGDSVQAAAQIQSLQEPGLMSGLRQHGYELVNTRYSHQASVAAFASHIDNIIEAEQHLTGFDESQFHYKTSGLLERIFGHKTGDRLRRLFNRPALVESAGDEWPHSLIAPGKDLLKSVELLTGASSIDAEQ